MLSGTKPSNTLEIFLTRLHESHELPVYESIERLVQAGEDAGFSSDALLRMLDQGKTFEELLELIEAKLQSLQKAA